MTNMINRRHTVLTIIAAALILLATTLTGCRKGSINGDLDGMWQILTIENLADGTTEDIKDSQLYYCLYLHTANLTKRGGVMFTANMTYEGDKLTPDFPTARPGALTEWGIKGTSVTFTIEHLTGSDLVMCSSDHRLTFRKY